MFRTIQKAWVATAKLNSRVVHAARPQFIPMVFAYSKRLKISADLVVEIRGFHK